MIRRKAELWTVPANNGNGLDPFAVRASSPEEPQAQPRNHAYEQAIAEVFGAYADSRKCPIHYRFSSQRLSSDAQWARSDLDLQTVARKCEVRLAE
jgi:hypothetical protein